MARVQRGSGIRGLGFDRSDSNRDVRFFFFSFTLRTFLRFAINEEPWNETGTGVVKR